MSQRPQRGPAGSPGVEGVILGFVVWLFFGLLVCYVPDASVPDQAYTQSFQRAQPVTVSGLVSLWVLATVFFLYQLATYETAHRVLPRSLWVALLSGVLGISCYFALVKPLTSGDVLYYVVYGRLITEYGVSPYEHLPIEYARDPFLASVTPRYMEIPAFYGPVPVAQYALANWVSPREDMLTVCSTLRLLSVPLCAAVGYLFFLFWKGARRPATLTFAVVANPVFLYMGVNSAHSEIWILLGLLLACLGLERDRPVMSAIGMVIACSTKIVSLAFLPVIAVLWYRKRPSGMALGVLVFLAVHGTMYGLLKGADYPLVLEASKGLAVMNMAIVGGPLVRFLLALSVPLKIAFGVGNVVFLFLLGWLCLWVFRGRCRLNPHGLTSLALAAMFFTRNYYQVWYIMWFWPSLWLAYRRERNVYIAVATWTLVMMLQLSWSWRIWAITAAYGHNVWLLWKEQEEGEIPAAPGQSEPAENRSPAFR